MLERISQYIHDKMWTPWAKTILSQENISIERKERWEKECFIPYEQLSEPMKELDRKFAKDIIHIINSSVKDRFMNLHENVNRLVDDYNKHGNLYIAFDFDNTVFDYKGIGDTFPKMESLLRLLKVHKFKLILFTANDGERLDRIIQYCKDRGYEPDYVNTSPVMKTIKPYYNILLDDRAGLQSAYDIMIMFLYRVEILK